MSSARNEPSLLDLPPTSSYIALLPRDARETIKCCGSTYTSVSWSLSFHVVVFRCLSLFLVWLFLQLRALKPFPASKRTHIAHLVANSSGTVPRGGVRCEPYALSGACICFSKLPFAWVLHSPLNVFFSKRS
jgi:hypothetical protein